MVKCNVEACSFSNLLMTCVLIYFLRGHLLFNCMDVQLNTLNEIIEIINVLFYQIYRRGNRYTEDQAKKQTKADIKTEAKEQAETKVSEKEEVANS